MHENEISGLVISAAMEVHRLMGGPGLLESIYEEALTEELKLRGLKVERQQSVPLRYKGRLIATPMRLDLLVSDRVLVECKATAEHNALFEAQLLTYLRLTGLKVGLVINFGRPLLKDGIRRVVNGL